MTADDAKYPEALLGLRTDLEGLLQAQGVAAEQAREIASAATEIIRQRWGGMYLPKGTGIDLSRRDREIGKRWNGANKIELCQQYNISAQRLYQILDRLRAEQVAARQLRMFG
jgi:Mor family transcriptional regulator